MRKTATMSVRSRDLMIIFRTLFGDAAKTPLPVPSDARVHETNAKAPNHLTLDYVKEERCV